MNSTTQQDQLEIVSALAASLADRMLMERLTQGTLPLANASRLWTASLLLEEHERPIPRIVADVLEQVRHVEPAEAPEGMDLESGPEPRPEPLPDVTAERHAGAAAPRRRRLTRLLRPFRQGTEA
ncbi:hypothetical protein [Methylobacterium fujisawaense]|uniref:hypothetical protein n=1 Tax=Methylobacterium fujisawaense TaxID=107400 RepID=UPI002448E1A4|nr:hypothetical protein [Methylobacterium fujisawaense]MDH3030860.1 hypothetical protein [Methylobacterium fujisawaense]